MKRIGFTTVPERPHYWLADARAQATYEDADAVLHTALEIQQHMEAQDRQISQILEEVQALRS